MNYLTQIAQISQMFYSKDSGILGFKKTKGKPLPVLHSLRAFSLAFRPISV